MPEHEMARIQEQVKTLFADFAELKCEIKDLKSEVRELRDMFANRLPLWATTLIGILLACLGWLIGRLV